MVVDSEDKSGLTSAAVSTHDGEKKPEESSQLQGSMSIDSLTVTGSGTSQEASTAVQIEVDP